MDFVCEELEFLVKVQADVVLTKMRRFFLESGTGARHHKKKYIATWINFVKNSILW